MKKFKKILATAIGAVMSLSAMGSLSANAALWFIDPLEVPDGYTQIEGTGYYRETTEGREPIFFVKRKYDTIKDTTLTIYNENTYTEQYIKLEFCMCNYTTFEVVGGKGEIFNDIYSKYSEKLDMDRRFGGPYTNYPDADYTVFIYDWKGEDGCCTMDTSQFEDKRELIQELSAELYSAGCISDASYKGVTYGSVYGYFHGIDVYKVYDDTDYEKMQAVLEKYNDAYVACFSEDSKLYKGMDRYSVKCSLAESGQIMSDLENLFPENAKVEPSLYELASSSQVGGKEVDLLAGLTTDQEILYGDLNLDGRVGISDIVMLNKNINGAVIFNENQQKAADLNANGAVDSEDLNILMQYLINIIDTLPFAN